MPAEGLEYVPRSDLLTYEEIERLAEIAVGRLGVDAIRLTGGEPTVRADLAELVRRLARLRTWDGAPVDLSLTTNGTTLRRQAEPLRAAGLGRVNISLDSLRPERFAAITRRDALDKVLDGIDAALEVGFSPVKVNVVVVRGLNDDELIDFAAFGRERGVQPRFIEFMPLDADGTWTMDQVVSSDEIVASIGAVYPLEEVPHGPEPASRLRYADGKGEIGVIASVTKPFCADCDRVRMTAEGQFRTCLFSTDEIDLRRPLRNGASDDELIDLLAQAVGDKWAGHRIGQVNFIRPKRSMSQIGG